MPFSWEQKKSREKTPEPCQSKLWLALLTEPGSAAGADAWTGAALSAFLLRLDFLRLSIAGRPQLQPLESWWQVQWQPLYWPQSVR